MIKREEAQVGFNVKQNQGRRTLCFVLGVCLIFSGALFPVGLSNAASNQKDLNTDQELNLSESAMRQIQALYEEKQSRSAEEQKIDSQLLYAYKTHQGMLMAEGIQTLRTDVKLDKESRILVDMHADVTDELLQDLERNGVEIVNRIASNIRARVDIRLIQELARMPQIVAINPATEFITLSSKRLQDFAQSPVVLAAINQSEGDLAHRAAEARDFYGYTGAGVKIGVLSDGVDLLAQSQASGDLPSNITVLDGQKGTGNEGSAIMEIIYDLAPDAQLYFATATGGIANFAKNIRDLRMVQHCDIIIDDVLYLAESPFHDGQTSTVMSPTNLGLIMQAVNDVSADGALYFSAAGNNGNKNDGTSATWEGNFVTTDTSSPFIHRYEGLALDNSVSVASSVIVLQWSDPLGASNNDYDIFVFNSSLTAIVAASTRIQNGDDDPIELTAARANERVVLARFGDTGVDRFLSLRAYGGGKLAVNTDGAAVGHSSAAAAFSIGAVSARGATGAARVFNGSEMLERFSSDGGRRLFYKADGTAITPGNFLASGGLLRQKPDFCAADNVATTAGTDFNPFLGTSAAAPHAAAIAALLLSAKRSSTPAQIKAALTSSALDIEAPGIDRDSGAGIVMAFQAMQALGAVPLPKVTEASIIGKHLFVMGRNFDVGAKILLDGQEVITKKDGAAPTTTIFGKKAAKTIAPGQTVTIQVRNSDGGLSNEFRFTRSAQ